MAYSLGNFLSTQSKPDQLIGAVLTLDLEQTVEPDGSVHCAVRGPKLHVTVTHYDAGKSNVRTYLFRDYTPELAKAHGVRAAYPNFRIRLHPPDGTDLHQQRIFGACIKFESERPMGRMECLLCTVFQNQY